MLVKNQDYVAKIQDFGCNGEGIAKIDGIPVFIPYAIAGETVRFRAVKVKSNLAYGKLMEVTEPSDMRVQPPCPVYYKCGGCNLQHIEYDAQLALKAKTVSDCFHKIAGIDIGDLAVEPSELHYRYRNKLQLPVRETGSGNVIGFFRENSHDVVAIDDCPIQREWAQKLICAVKKYIADSGVSCYNEQTKRGMLRHVVAREAGGQFIITLVSTSEKLPQIDILKCELEKTGRYSLFINVNKSDSNVIFGSRTVRIFGNETALVEEDGLSFRMGPESFMQVNDGVRRKIYAEVCSLAARGGTVIDAYCGAGFLSAMLSRRADMVYGIESVEEAIACANRLKEENGIENLEFICGLCEDVLPRLIPQIMREKGDFSVVLDPPRKGCDGAVLNALLDTKPRQIIYISCSPPTLARDVGILTGSLIASDTGLGLSADQNGPYEIQYIKSFDMFPQTKHVETLVCLERKQPK